MFELDKIICTISDHLSCNLHDKKMRPSFVNPIIDITPLFYILLTRTNSEMCYVIIRLKE